MSTNGLDKPPSLTQRQKQQDDDDKKNDNNGNDDDHHNKDDYYQTMSISELRKILTLRGYDCSQCLEKSDLVAAAHKLDATNYDDEAYELFRALNLRPGIDVQYNDSNDSASSSASRYSNLNVIWKHPDPSGGGGSVYVGNYVAASDWRTLRERNIVAVINCQDAKSKNYFENEKAPTQPGRIQYHRFMVSRLAVSRDQTPLAGGFQQAFDFIEHHISPKGGGNSVLIHCLAGAHRAGTLGTAWLMYKTGKGVNEALQLAKACRPIINPFGTLLELLHRLKSELEITNTRRKTRIESTAPKQSNESDDDTENDKEKDKNNRMETDLKN